MKSGPWAVIMTSVPVILPAIYVVVGGCGSGWRLTGSKPPEAYKSGTDRPPRNPDPTRKIQDSDPTRKIKDLDPEPNLLPQDSLKIFYENNCIKV